MAFWADPDDLPRLYPHNHSQCVEYLAYVTQEVPASLFPSSEGSSNHFDTPDASISVKTTSGSKQEELYTRPHLVNSTASLQTTQGSHFTPGTIGTAALTNSYPGSGSVDSILMQVHGSVSGLGSTQDMFQRGGDSTPEHPGEMYEYGGNHDLATPIPNHDNQTNMASAYTTFIHDGNMAVQFEPRYYGEAHSPYAEVTASPFPPMSTEPWTVYRAAYDQNHQPAADDVMFAPDPRIRRSSRNAQQQGRELHKDKQGNVDPAGPTALGFSVEDEEKIDTPPTGDPTGPPTCNFGRNLLGPPQRPQAKKRGCRQGRLKEANAKHARAVRVIGACWNCRLMKYECDPETIGPCPACVKARHQSVLTLSCIRAPLPEFTGLFLPASLMAQHKEVQLCHFARQHVRSWTKNNMTVFLTWGNGQPIKCEVQEFEPQGYFSLGQPQHRLNLVTNKYETVWVYSPPIGMVVMTPEAWPAKLRAYLDREAEENFSEFPRRCYQGFEFQVQKEILEALHGHHVALKRKIRALSPEPMGVKAPQEIQILVEASRVMKLCLVLLIITHMMTRTLTLVENTKEEVYSKLWSPPRAVFGAHSSSRLLNKQLKFILAPLHRESWANLLDSVQKTLLVEHKAKRGSWATLLACLLTLAMTMESVQISIRCKEATEKHEGAIPEDNDDATLDLARMEEKWTILLDLFHKRYPRFNPLGKEDHRDQLDIPSRDFARNIHHATEKHREFLESRLTLEPPLTSADPNTSRLVAKMLLPLLD